MSVVERLAILKDVESEIVKIMKYSGDSLSEISKEKVNEAVTEENIKRFTESVQLVDKQLSAQIDSLLRAGSSAPHEGSIYNVVKENQLINDNINHLRQIVAMLAKVVKENDS